METNNTQKANSSAGNIEPPFRKGEQRRNDPILRRIKKQIKQSFRKIIAPVDIVLSRSCKVKQAEREYPHVLSLNETVDLLIGGASICRFGDGEFNCLPWQHSATKKTPDKTLSRRLEEVLTYTAYLPPPKIP